MEVVIELGREDRNINVLVEPLSEPRRGSWSNNVLTGGRPNQLLALVPDLPGFRVALDTSARSVRVYDPLGEPGAEEKLRRVQERFSKRGDSFRPASARKVENMDERRMEKWLSWMRRVVRAGNAKVVKGEFPKPEPKQQQQKQPA